MRKHWRWILAMALIGAICAVAIIVSALFSMFIGWMVNALAILAFGKVSEFVPVHGLSFLIAICCAGMGIGFSLVSAPFMKSLGRISLHEDTGRDEWFLPSLLKKKERTPNEISTETIKM